MPRNPMNKIDLQARIYKYKTALYEGEYEEMSEEWHQGGHDAMNRILDALQEFRD
jgi:hypothetical protein